jgi:hypothetical protein
MKKTLITATTFALMLAFSAAAPFGISFSDGVQLADKAAAAGAHKQMKEKGKKHMKDKKAKMSGKEMSDMKKGKGMGKGKGAEMKEKMKGKMKK